MFKLWCERSIKRAYLSSLFLSAAREEKPSGIQERHVLKPGTPEHPGTPEDPGTREQPKTPGTPNLTVLFCSPITDHVRKLSCICLPRIVTRKTLEAGSKNIEKKLKERKKNEEIKNKRKEEISK